MFYMGAALIASETPQEKVQHFEAAKCLSWCKLSVYMFFLYELWHHYNDSYEDLLELWQRLRATRARDVTSPFLESLNDC